MQIQTLLLSLIILISLFVTQNSNRRDTSFNQSNNGGSQQVVQSSFVNNLSSAFSQKVSSLGSNLEILGSSIKEKSNNIFDSIQNFTDQTERGLISTENKISGEIQKSGRNFINKLAEGALKEKIKTPPVATSYLAENEINNNGPKDLINSPSNCTSINTSNLKGEASLVKYLNQNLTIFEKNTERRWPIASITKLMTSVIALENLNLDQNVKMSEKAATVGGMIGEFKEGEVFKAKDLLRAMIVGSSNDAAVALAASFGESKFVDAMQRKARDLGMYETTYIEPTGLSFVNQSTVNDLNKLMNYVYKNHPEILEISRQKEVSILELKSSRSRTIENVDLFAGEPDFIGGKTGFIDEAGRNLVALFDLRNQTVLTIVLGADNAFEETRMMKNFVYYCKSLRP